MSGNTYRIVLWSSVIGSLALVVFGMIWLAKGGGQPHIVVPGINEITDDDYVIGKLDSDITLVEFADFQCPACSVAYKSVAQLEKEYGNQVRFVYRNFPIPGHTNGLFAAYAAGAAGAQGKFFEMAEILFAKQQEWSVLSSNEFGEAMDSYAQILGLNMNKFRTDKVSDTIKTKVDKDYQSGINAGVDSTPTFFLNGEMINLTSFDYDTFKQHLDAALKP